MVPRPKDGRSPLERMRLRYENSRKKCTDCGYVDREGNWESRTDGRQVVYRHDCPSCGSSSEHVFDLDR